MAAGTSAGQARPGGRARHRLLLTAVVIVAVCLVSTACGGGSSPHSTAASADAEIGHIRLDDLPGGQSLKLLGTFLGTVNLPVVDASKVTPAQATSAFLAQYAFYLLSNNDFQASQIEEVVSTTPAVLAQLSSKRAEFKAHYGNLSRAMPMFWDAPSAAAEFTATKADGATTITLSGGTVYYRVLDPATPVSDEVWQDPRGRDRSAASPLTSLSLTFGAPTNSGGYALSFVSSFTLK